MNIDIAKLNIDATTVLFVGYPPGMPPKTVGDIQQFIDAAISPRGGTCVLIPGPLNVTSVTKTDAKWLAEEILAKLKPAVKSPEQTKAEEAIETMKRQGYVVMPKDVDLNRRIVVPRQRWYRRLWETMRDHADLLFK